MASDSERIVIAGAGPVGLVLALALVRGGDRVTLFEAGAHLHKEARAATIHPATLDLLDDLGAYDRIAPLGLIAPVVHYWDRHADSLIAAFDHAVLRGETRHPHVLQCEQDKVAEILLAMVKELPDCEVRMSTRVTGFEQAADHVEAIVVNADGEEERIRGRYLVGADGARSVVREAMGVAFEGFTYPDRVLIVGTPFDFARHHGYALRNYLSDPVEWANLFKISWRGPPGLWRLVLPTRPEEDPEEILGEESVQQRLQRFHPHPGPYEVVIRDLYTVHQRVAKTFRQGRVLLAGDAAHVNSPIGAMGMNGGIHDAVNLAGKLLRIRRREAGEEALDRYVRQRRHIAVEHTQAQTILNKRRLEERDPAVRRKHNGGMRRAAADPVLAKRFLMRTALIDSLRTADAIP